MKERPIIFNAEMIRAILDGRKTQTRRVVNFPKAWTDMVTHDDLEASGFWNACQNDEGYHRWQYGDEYLPRQNYQIGGRLWVRETFRVCDVAGEPFRPRDILPTNAHCFYRADHEPEGAGIWRPSIHMPRWASRLNLIVTDVRVERVQEISGAGAIKEGVAPWREWDLGREDKPTPIDEFATLWNSINEKRGFGWDTNPWVWVIEFEKARTR